MTAKMVISPNAFHRHQTLSAVVIKACPHCNAPGVYTNRADVEYFWPGCFVESTSSLLETPVGNTCPNCGKTRLPNESKKLLDKWEYKLSWQGLKLMFINTVRRLFK